MKLKQLAAAALVGGALVAASPAFAQPRKAHRLVGQGLLQGRGRRPLRGDQEVRGEVPEVQGRTVAVCTAGNHPQDGGGDGRRQPARRRLRRRLRLPGHGQVGQRWQARGRDQHHRADARQVRAARAVHHLPLQRRGTRRGRTTPTRSSSRPCTSSTGRTCWPRRGSRKATSRRTGRATGSSGARRCSRPTARRPATAAFRHRLPDGRGFERLVLLVPDLHGRLQRQAGQRFGQAAGRRPGRARRPDQGHDRLHLRLQQGLHAAVGHGLEGPGQQRRLPQQDDHHDAQRDDLDRREVARRHEQRHAHRSATRAGEEELHRVDRHGRLPEQARRHEDDLPRRGQDRCDLQGRQEQGGRQGVRRLHARRCQPDALCRRLARTLVPGDQGRAAERLLEGRPAPPGRCTTSSWPAPRPSNSPRTTSSRC